MGGVGWGGWLDTDNKTISVQLDLTGTATGTELGNLTIGQCVPCFSEPCIGKTIRYNKLGLSCAKVNRSCPQKCLVPIVVMMV